MDAQVESVEKLKDPEESEQVLELKLLKPSDLDEGADSVNTDISNDDSEKAEQEKSDDVEENHLSNKNLTAKETNETSPFKQAVRGFVLSKLSKKVGSHHILSGLTEKIVKKLEDNKDNSQSISVSSSESDLSISNLKVKDTSSEVIFSSVSCELKSVVDNNLALVDSLNIEDAIECTEEPESSISKINFNLKVPQKKELRSSSISLPSSPAHQIPKRASSISFSLENSESPKKYSHSPNLIFLGENKNNEIESKSKNAKLINEIELDEIKSKSSNVHDENNKNSKILYPHNIYREVEEKHNFKMPLSRQVVSILYNFKKNFALLTLPNFFLLTLVIVHNVGLFSSYLAFIFDGVVIAYVLYSHICTLVLKPNVSKITNFPFSDPHLESTSIQIQKTNKIVKGSVKVLKGEYDPEMVKNHPTDLVDISIENCCLKIFAPKKKNKETSKNLISFTFYDILGATVSILPKDLSKKRIWNKKYPICITLPCVAKHASTPEDENDANLPSTDYLSSVCNESDGTERKALYFFAVTDREKESLFWAILRNTDEKTSVKDSENSCDISRIDFSRMNYATLLELNSEDNSIQNKDISEDDSSVVGNNNPDLEFEKYMKHLFESFDRMNKFSSRSRSFEDLSNFKEDISKSTDSFISKDDTFLSSSTKEYSIDWMNVFLGRIFYDFLTQKRWSDEVKARIQKKLDKIEMPSFIESLEVTDVFLGTSLPQIHTISSPVADINGVWFNVDFNYCGSFQMTLKTKLKMIKTKQMPGAEAIEQTDMKQSVHSLQLSESDDDEDIEAKLAAAKKKKFINRIEKWISHKHFQTVAQNRFVKKYVGDLSNMPLTLTVELNTLHGTLTLNIPPAPSDRIWYGFRKDPVLLLNAYPKVGTHEINFSAVVQMIEKKLIQEFKKALVMPNMDDLLIPVMYSPIYEFQ